MQNLTLKIELSPELADFAERFLGSLSALTNATDQPKEEIPQVTSPAEDSGEEEKREILRRARASAGDKDKRDQFKRILAEFGKPRVLELNGEEARAYIQRLDALSL